MDVLPEPAPEVEPEPWALHRRWLGALARAAVLVAPGLPLVLIGAVGGLGGRVLAALAGALALVLCPLLLERPDLGWRQAVGRWVAGLSLGALLAPLVTGWLEARLEQGTGAAYQALGGLVEGDVLLPWVGAALGLFLAPWVAARAVAGRGPGAQLRGLLLADLGAGLGAGLAVGLQRGPGDVAIGAGAVAGMGLVLALVLGALGALGDALAAWLDPGAPRPAPEQPRERRLRERLATLLAAVGGALLGQELVRELAWDHHPTEAVAISTLKSIATAQRCYREADEDGDGAPDFAGSVAALGQAGLLDDVTASGVRQGYVYRVVRSAAHPELVWAAAADSLRGERHFAIDVHERVWWAKDPIPLDPASGSPIGSVQPVGGR